MTVMPGKKPIVVVLIISVLWIGLPPLARAAAIPTGRLIALQEQDALPSRVTAVLAREEVRAQFVALGVSPTEVEQRLSALTDDELWTLDRELRTLPAGGLLEILGVILVVLIILELLGVTDVFKKI